MMATTPLKFVSVHDKVNSQLPGLNLTADDVERYPDFCSLLSDISLYINKDGLSPQTQKDLEQAEEVLRREKHRWLLNHILYTELQELLLDYEIKSHDISLSSRDKQCFQKACFPGASKGVIVWKWVKRGDEVVEDKTAPIDKTVELLEASEFYSILQQCLTRAEVGEFLDFSPDPSSKVTALGMTKEDLDRQNPHKKHMESLQQVLIPEIEDRLRRKCEHLVVAHDPENSSSDSSKLMFAKSSQLPAIVESDIQHLKEEQALLKDDYRKREKQFSLYYQKLSESLKLLEKLFTKYKLQLQSENDTVTSEWLVAKCDAMCLKIRLIELQILCETYTVETVQSLRIVSKQLDDAIKKKDSEKLHRQQALKAYTSLDDDFNNIVSEFGKLKDELENKQWALKQFEKSQ